MRPPTSNPITQTAHLASQAVDYSSRPDVDIYAPENGRIESYQQRGSGTSDAGNCLRLAGATGMHQFAHLEQSYVQVGQNVVKGQRIAKMGYTGYTIPSGPNGRHVHYWVLTHNGYVYPPNLYTEPYGANPTNNQGDSMFNTREEIIEAYLLLRGQHPSDPEINGWIGQSKQRFFQIGKAEADSYRAERDQLRAKVNEVETALNNERAKPPKEIIRTVTEIVDRPVEVEKIVTVYTHDEALKSDVAGIKKIVGTIRALILNLFRRKK